VLNRNLQLGLIALLLCISSLWAQQTKMIIFVDRAPVYAEPSENSIKIDNIMRGTVLTLFERGIEGSEWIYVTYQSKRWKGKVTGFIKAELVATEEEMLKEDQRRMEEEARVEEAAPKPEEETEATPEAETKHPEELPDLREAFTPKEAEEKKEEEKKPEEPLEAQVEQKPEITPPEEQVPGKKEEVKPEIVPEEQIEPETELLPTEAEIPEKEQKEEILEALPQAQEVAPPPIKIEKKEEFKRDEVFPKPEIKTTIKPVDLELPESRTVSEPESEETEEPKAFAVIQREFPPPPPRDVKAQTEIPEENPLEEELFKIKVAEPEPEKGVVESPKDETPPPPPAKVEEEKVEEVKEVKEEPEEEPQVIKTPEQVVPPKDIIRPETPPTIKSKFTVGFGYGPSLGGLGTFVQFNTKSNLSLHAGVGFYPATAYYSQYDWLKNEVLYSIGIKYYLPFGNHKFFPYVDVQYGGVSVEAVQTVIGIWYGDYVYENIQKTLYGPSVLAGIELRTGALGLNAAFGLTYNTTEWDYWDQDLFLNGDVGVVIYF
jgi:hypothetical protein